MEGVEGGLGTGGVLIVEAAMQVLASCSKSSSGVERRACLAETALASVNKRGGGGAWEHAYHGISKHTQHCILF